MIYRATHHTPMIILFAIRDHVHIDWIACWRRARATGRRRASSQWQIRCASIGSFILRSMRLKWRTRRVLSNTHGRRFSGNLFWWLGARCSRLCFLEEWHQAFLFRSIFSFILVRHCGNGKKFEERVFGLNWSTWHQYLCAWESKKIARY